MLLTACADNAPALVETTEQATSCTTETTPQSTSSTTTVVTAATTTTTATTTAPQEIIDFPEENVIYPTISMDENNWRVEYVVDEEDVIAQLGYDTPVDVTQDVMFESAQRFAEQLYEELREQYIDRNYSWVDFDSSFVGSEKADWLYIATYQLICEGPNYGGYYTVMFYVKDGIITQTLAEFYNGCLSGMTRRGDGRVSVSNNGSAAIYSFIE